MAKKPNQSASSSAPAPTQSSAPSSPQKPGGSKPGASGPYFDRTLVLAPDELDPPFCGEGSTSPGTDGEKRRWRRLKATITVLDPLTNHDVRIWVEQLFREHVGPQLSKKIAEKLDDKILDEIRRHRFQ